MAENFDWTLDVLVIGGGGCGLAAAIAAHDAGAETAIVEKLDRAGGNTALSTGSVPGAGSRFQRAAGIQDSPEQMIADYERNSGEHPMLAVMRRLARDSAALVEWLVDAVGARLAIITDYKHVGHSVPRLHAPVSRRGQDLLDDLVAAAERRGIVLACGNGVRELVTASDGRVVGAVIESNKDEVTRVGAKKVVLATNGYAANRELVAQYCAEIAGAEYFGARGSTGEAVLWGRKLGAALANMGAYQGYATVAYPQGSILSWTTVEKGGVIVDANGDRFGEEARTGYSDYARLVLGATAPVHAVFDERIRRIADKEEEFHELMEMKGAKVAATPRELARLIGAEPGSLAASVASLVPPLYAVRVVPGLFHTQGGLLVDEQAHVLREDGSVVANLFAGGGAAAGISGRSGAAGYASGNGLLTALGLGRIAGLTAAAEIQR
ncbi:MAG TPA: FAD-binding protein [Burkholderiales bacterium]|nr:FAD-binding protein [Burkholderiales bacterium]